MSQPGALSLAFHVNYLFNFHKQIGVISIAQMRKPKLREVM